jgi:predicted solute-binding protein
MKDELGEIIEHSLNESGNRYGEIGELSGKRIGLTKNEVEDYLGGFNYTLGERERESMREFRQLAGRVGKTAKHTPPL